jgi:eukaryotic-like serine/threonine-protein kinase
MALSSGSHVGPYEILAAIGAGGMGEVYRARDAKLGRDVALKVLPQAFARDADRLARFQREAKVLASLNHSNIASIYGLEDSGSTHALVMELVEGPTLADRIKSGPIPIDESLRIAKQITEALEYAHERGIVHRDLKPANIKVTADDTVKILDFGLAKALDGDAASLDISTSPTISRMATQAGILLGTAAYMSPEQAKGKSVDRRADIWAFGCVLFEMLTRNQTFTGETVTDTLAAVIREEPNCSQLPGGTPMRVRILLQRCLQKDPKQRLQAIGDARISLDEVLSGAPEPSSAVREQPSAITSLMRLEISLPDQTALAVTSTFAISPDGRHLAFAARSSDANLRLWIRSLDSLEARPLHGSESVLFPPFFWSRDSRFIVFDSGGKLKKIGIAGGPAQTLCEIAGVAVSGTWSHDDVILFGQAPGGIMRVSANGGPASPVTIPDASRKEIWHVQPSFLPDERHFIYLRGSEKPEHAGICIGSLDAKPEEQDSRRIVPTHLGAAYAPPSDPGAEMGQLLYVRDKTLMAQPFDPRRLELRGEPVQMAKQLGFLLTFGFFSVSTNGILVYRTGGGASQLTWFDQRGKPIGTAGEPAAQLTVNLSPDGARAIVCRSDSQGANLGLWLLDLSRGTSTRFTFSPTIAIAGVWAPDSNRIIFGAGPAGRYDLYQKLATGVRDAELVLESTEAKIPTNWSRDGRFLLYRTFHPTTRKRELWVLPLEGDKRPIPFLCTQFNNDQGQFSPDGHWVAYVSDESGRDEIYVRTFSPDFGGAASDDEVRWLISTGGGSEPRWSGDGKTLYYIASDGKLMTVEIATTPVFQAGKPKGLFQMPWTAGGTLHGQSWNVSPDGKRFLFSVPTEQGTAPFNVVLNWQAGLKK